MDHTELTTRLEELSRSCLPVALQKMPGGKIGGHISDTELEIDRIRSLLGIKSIHNESLFDQKAAQFDKLFERHEKELSDKGIKGSRLTNIIGIQASIADTIAFIKAQSNEPVSSTNPTTSRP